MCFILDSFYCYVFNSVNLFLCNVKSSVNLTIVCFISGIVIFISLGLIWGHFLYLPYVHLTSLLQLLENTKYSYNTILMSLYTHKYHSWVSFNCSIFLLVCCIFLLLYSHVKKQTCLKIVASYILFSFLDVCDRTTLILVFPS